MRDCPRAVSFRQCSSLFLFRFRPSPTHDPRNREREAKDKAWEDKKAAKLAEVALRKKDKRRREKEGDGGDEVWFQTSVGRSVGRLFGGTRNYIGDNSRTVKHRERTYEGRHDGIVEYAVSMPQYLAGTLSIGAVSS